MKTTTSHPQQPDHWTHEPPQEATYHPHRGHLLRRLYDILVWKLARTETRHFKRLLHLAERRGYQNGVDFGRGLGFTDGYEAGVATCLICPVPTASLAYAPTMPERITNTGPIVQFVPPHRPRPTGSLMREMGERVGRPNTVEMKAIRLKNELFRLEQQQGKRASTP